MTTQYAQNIQADIKEAARAVWYIDKAFDHSSGWNNIFFENFAAEILGWSSTKFGHIVELAPEYIYTGMPDDFDHKTWYASSLRYDDMGALNEHLYGISTDDYHLDSAALEWKIAAKNLYAQHTNLGIHEIATKVDALWGEFWPKHVSPEDAVTEDMSCWSDELESATN